MGTHTDVPVWDDGLLAVRERRNIAAGLCSTLAWNLAVCTETAVEKHCCANCEQAKHKRGYEALDETVPHVLFVYMLQG